ncbi:Protein CBG01966 [Caenorhabditis briggsae]|uniref:Uncharacterized protein n=3 Tax=Caenorhabditis TaxID=6237 RepID=A0AAE8ZPK8_CAEBR|nr:Protein CBG01966 [Caenorhabditis briggsae]PIC16267.1 hypothetical protein B9Z55_022928 [Caenorhabditis nigoni]ULT80476.1 hypothetical protein L3Y34_010798 [Caenorhabditis briggsae]UMM39775.1 hypothetical protein L5515_016681 [Caenorhabditis briggsae]CAP23155.1 Protein CBG01966 [Caenorhabditis briggsae]
MRSLLVLLALVAVAYSQNRLNCGFSCSRRTVVSAIIDGQPGTATCSENTSPTRCSGCCEARALQEGLSVNNAAGFISNDQRTCVCCFNNTNRNCQGGNTFFDGK